MNKKMLFALVALVVVVGLMAGVWFATRPQPEEPKETNGTQASGEPTGTTAPQFKHSFTVIVVHMDGTEKTFQYQTNEDYLGPVLVEEGLIEEAASPGMYDTVDGVKADYSVDQSYWAFYEGDNYAMQGMDDTLITDGAVYKLVHTK